MAKKTSKRSSAAKRKAVGKRTGAFRRALHRLKRLKQNHQCQAIGMANDAFIRQMCTHVKKLRYNKKVNSKSAQRLKRHRGKLRQLVSPRTTLAKKRKILGQRGGFLPALLPLLISTVGPLVGGIAKAVTKKIF